MGINIVQADLNIAPKDCSQSGIKSLPCDTGERNSLYTPSLGMAYVPMQQYKELYDADYALQVGTIFKELDLPFYGIGGTLL
ncbi:spore coat associated protein CotJA [Anaerocolumna sp. AGMB13025]|uniref:spore coat associated protein CotJA n=1 Tax=Anaerocolumna sp. AGMB13025 TaxID=3039116 RepID=UPI00241F149B|nr:spore coat associated protein CotJA [Anaerocolumna sp. AGMB13025]WFR57435.1 spore coat associated protein CotJA [Anaerocolumna sp. AGMB13025]